MQSHKVISAGVTHTVPAAPDGHKHYVRIKSITVLGSGNVTLTVTNAAEGGYTAVFNSAVGQYKGYFQFRPRDQVVFVVDASTTLLLEGYEILG